MEEALSQINSERSEMTLREQVLTIARHYVDNLYPKAFKKSPSNCEQVMVDFEAGAWTGFSKAIELLRSKQAESIEDFTGMTCENVAKWLESKLEEK